MHRLPSQLPKLDPSVRALLDDLRRRIRLYVWGHGVSTAVACLGAAFWLSLLLDWFFEPSPGFRFVLLLALAAGLTMLVGKLVVRRLQVPLTDANMAMLLERRFPELDDTVLTAVSLSGERDRTDSAHGTEDALQADMFARTCREARDRVKGVRPAAVFNPVPLRRSILAATVLALSIVIFALWTPASLGVWTRRSLLLSEELWPRRTRLDLEGFENGCCKVARGGDLDIVARAWLDMPLVPSTVELRYRTESGASGRATMNREGVAEPGRDTYQQYTHTFQGILSSIDFDLVGGDARLRDLHVEVVDSPKIEQLSLVCDYPAYMGRTNRTVPEIGPMRIPAGTRILIEGRTNKPLVRVRVDRASDALAKDPVLLQPDEAFDDQRGFFHQLEALDQDRTLLFTLYDTDGIQSPEPRRLVLTAVVDQPPELSVALDGIGSAITPRARVPVAGTIRDDYGLAEIWFDYTVDEAPPARQDVTVLQGNSTELPVESILDVEKLRLQPGQKLLIGLKASDRYDLDSKPHEGTSQRWQLEVVTPEQLRTRLQARELTLRHRFERIMQEVTETRDSLARIAFAAEDAPKEKEAGESDMQPESPSGREPGDKPADWAGREPGEKTDEPTTLATAEDEPRTLAVRSLRCERAIQNSRKNGNETEGTAEAFDDIRLQLINNQIDAEEWKARLKSGISDPLRVVADKMFPELEIQLLALRESLKDDKVGPERLDAAKRQVDAILVAMNRVLDRMMELEDFNEAIALLEEIIEMQKKLEEQTRQRHKAALRDLLEQ